METQPLKERQYTVYVLLLMVTTVLISLVYQTFNRNLVLFRRAESHYSRGDYNVAKSLYEQAILMGLHRTDAVVNLLSAYREIGLRDADIMVMDKIIDMTNTPETLAATIDWFASQHNWSESIDLLMRRSNSWVNEPGIMFRLADMYRNTDNQKEAEQYYRKALLLSPRSLYGRFRLAETLAWQRRYDEAETIFRNILADHPGHRLSMIYLARILSWQAQFREAIDIYLHVLGEST